MSMYTFSKESWHVKFFKWLFDEDPTKLYKTMCPYFWSYVLVFILLPFILLIKLFGRVGTRFLTRIKNNKRIRRDKFINDLNLTYGRSDLTPLEAYNFRRSKVYKNYWFYMDNNVTDKIDILHEVYLDINSIKELDNTINIDFNDMISNLKEYKAYNYFSYLFTFTLLSFILYSIYLGFSYIIVDWLSILGGLLTLIIFASGGFTIYSLFILISELLVRLYDLYLINVRFSILLKPFIWFFKGVSNLLLIIKDMIVSTYKKSCPIITWEDK